MFTKETAQSKGHYGTKEITAINSFQVVLH